MKRYLRVEQGVVVEVFETDQDIKEMFHPDLVWVECNDIKYGIGSFYSNKTFNNPEKQNEFAELERLWRDSELTRADVELYKAQDSDPKSVGSVSDWRFYRKALRAWPESKGFPKEAHRPVAPDTKE